MAGHAGWAIITDKIAEDGGSDRLLEVSQAVRLGVTKKHSTLYKAECNR